MAQAALVAVLVVGFTQAARADVPQGALPALAGPVNDGAHILGYQGPAMAERLARLNRAYGVQLVVLTVPSLAGEPIAAFAHRVSDAWRLGEAQTDTGLLLLIAPNERQTRLEVGYGLEGILPDAVAKRILAENLRPGPGGTLGAAEVMRTVDVLADCFAAAHAKGLLPVLGRATAKSAYSDWGMQMAAGAIVLVLLAIYLLRRLPANAPGPRGHLGGPTAGLGHGTLPKGSPSPWRMLAWLLAATRSSGGPKGPGGSDDDSYRGGGGGFGGGGSSDRY